MKRFFCVKSKILYLIICHESFLDYFHGIDTVGFLEFHHQNLGIAPTSNHSDQLEILQAILSLTSWLQPFI